MTGSLFDEPAYCQTCGRETTDNKCAWCTRSAAHLARRNDPHTSHLAAKTLNHRLKEHHTAVLDWYRAAGPQTDDQVAQAMVDTGWTARNETARRWVRTLREEHDGLIVPWVDPATGVQGTARNQSGRVALLWQTTRR